MQIFDNALALQRFTSSDFVTLSGLAYPTADLAGLELANEWGVWLFNWDDLCDRTFMGEQPQSIGYVQNRFLEILNGSELTGRDGAPHCALADIRDRMIARDPGGQMEWFIKSVSDYFEGCIWEAHNREDLIIPPIDEYLKMRQKSGAVITVFELFGFTGVCVPTQEMRDSAAFAQLQQMANNIICWANDIFSFSREAKKGDVHNLVILTIVQDSATTEGMDVYIAEAERKVVERHNEEVGRYLAAKKKLATELIGSKDEFEKYCAGMEAWIYGNFFWSTQSDRYKAGREVSLKELGKKRYKLGASINLL